MLGLARVRVHDGRGRRGMQTPKIPMPPLFQEGWHLLDGKPVTRKLYDMMVLELTQMNKAVDTLPDLSDVSVA